jgi:signal transduction histidine kinase/CheY-like chemotaxis protein
MSYFIRQLERFTFYNYFTFSCISAWLLLLFSSFFIDNGPARISALAAKMEFLVHFITIAILIRICQKTLSKSRNNMLWLLAISMPLLVIDFCYYIASYAENKLSGSLLVEFLLDDFPGMIGCLFIIFFIVKVLLKDVLPHKKIIKISIFFILADVIVMLLFFSSLKYMLVVFTWKKITQVFILAEQIIQYNLAIIGLIYAIDMSAVLLLVGLITLLAGAYSFILKILNFFPYAEMLWFLGLLFILFSVLNIEKSKNYEFNNWFRKENTIKSQLALWAFSISMGGFLLFFCITYSFSMVDKTVFIGLPLYVMMYSIIAVILSIIMSRKFEIPFRKIEKNIDRLKQLDSKPNIDDDFSAEEFIYLQKFIVDAFYYKEEKDRAKKQIGEITAQVAHDIRSPLAAMDTIISSTENRAMTKSEKVMIRTAFRRINNITNDLVAKYKGKIYDPDTLVFIYVAIKDIVSEKDLEYCRYNISFEIYLDNPQSAFLLTEGNYKEINRMFSNLINNSVNAMENGGLIKIFCGRNADNILVRIVDQGCGISNARIAQYFTENENLEIGEEIGFGLKHARNYFKKHGGDIKINSVIGGGAEALLSFPISSRPRWLADKVEIDFNKPVMIIDDDASIHDVWTKKLEGLSVTRHDFYTIDQAREHLLKNELPGIILCDYEFFGSEDTGLDFLESIKNLKSEKYLVTTHVDNFEIIERCEDNDFQLIPKHLLPYISIYEKFNLSVARLDNNAIPDVVLIDDQIYNHDFWRYKAKKKRKSLNCYMSLDEFMKEKNLISFNTPIYIDLNLGEARGLDVAEKLHQEGFCSLYITTGFVNFDVNKYAYITGVVGKSPPF